MPLNETPHENFLRTPLVVQYINVLYQQKTNKLVQWKCRTRNNGFGINQKTCEENGE